MLEGLGEFIAEQIAKSVREAQERQKQAQAAAQKPAQGQPQTPSSLAALRAQYEAEAAKRASRGGITARPGTPPRPTQPPSPPRRQPNLTPQAKPAVAPPATPRRAAPVLPTAPIFGDLDVLAIAAPIALEGGSAEAAFRRPRPRLAIADIFSNPQSLVGAIVVGEALSAPLSLRPGGVARPSS